MLEIPANTDSVCCMLSSFIEDWESTYGLISLMREKISKELQYELIYKSFQSLSLDYDFNIVRADVRVYKTL